MSEDPVAVIWDFDGTIVDSRRKNLNVTRAIVRDVTGRDPDTIPALADVPSYQAALMRHANWRVFYGRELGLDEAGVDDAGALWAEMQLADATEAPVFDGIGEVVEGLADIPQGIVSQNGRGIIEATLRHAGLAGHFDAIVGYVEVGFARQKPDPAGFVRCLESLTNLAPGVVFTIGDHETDAECARNTAAFLQERGIDVRVVSVGAFWGERPAGPWSYAPDHEAFEPGQVLRLIDVQRS
jgi:HAD superfamily hydrolase (TIGR01549 family)